MFFSFFFILGLGSGFPVLKKRQQAEEADEDNQKTHSQVHCKS